MHRYTCREAICLDLVPFPGVVAPASSMRRLASSCRPAMPLACIRGRTSTLGLPPNLNWITASGFEGLYADSGGNSLGRAAGANTTDLSRAGSREAVTWDFSGLRGGSEAFCLAPGKRLGVDMLARLRREFLKARLSAIRPGQDDPDQINPNAWTCGSTAA